MQVLGISNTEAGQIVQVLQDHGWKPLIDRAPIHSNKRSIAVYTGIKSFMDDLPAINESVGQTAILCSSVIRQTELDGIVPLDWKSTQPGVYNLRPLQPSMLLYLLENPKHRKVKRNQRFVTLLINDLKSCSVLQPILEQIYLLSLSAQKTCREYTFRVLAGEKPKRPSTVPAGIEPLLTSPAAVALGAAVQKILAKRLTYKNAVAQGINDYELRYVIKGLKTLGRHFSGEVDKLFWARDHNKNKKKEEDLIDTDLIPSAIATKVAQTSKKKVKRSAAVKTKSVQQKKKQ